MDSDNLYVAVSSPNLNFNISRPSNDPLTVGSKVTGQERFYSVSTGIDVEVRMVFKGVLCSSENDVGPFIKPATHLAILYANRGEFDRKRFLPRLMRTHLAIFFRRSR